jgi:hypothetical protein
LAHLEQFVLHAAKYGAEIDAVHTIEFRQAGIGDFRNRALNTGVVECRIQPAEARNRSLYHGFYLPVIGHVAQYADGFVSGGDQFLGGCPNRGFIDIRQRDRGAFCRKGARGGDPIPEAAPVTSATLPSKDILMLPFSGSWAPMVSYLPAN